MESKKSRFGSDDFPLQRDVFHVNLQGVSEKDITVIKPTGYSNCIPELLFHNLGMIYVHCTPSVRICKPQASKD